MNKSESNNLYDKIKFIVTDIIKINEEITPNSYLINDLNIDSITFFIILAKIEDEYKIEVDPEFIYLKNQDITFQEFVNQMSNMIKKYI